MRVQFLALANILLWALPSVASDPFISLQLNTTRALGLNSRVYSSSGSFSHDYLTHPYFTLNNVLFTEFYGLPPYYEQSGFVNLSFTLTIGAEAISQTASFKWYTYDNRGGIGAPGADAYVNQIIPLVFDFDIGSMHLTSSYASTILLGQPLGSTVYAPLRFNGYFVPIPEPPSLLLFLLSAVPLVGSQRRAGNRRSFGCVLHIGARRS